MMRNRRLLWVGLLLLAVFVGVGSACNFSKGTTQMAETNYFRIETPQGSMVLRLYDETPLHRDNFKKLVAEGTYDSTLFHRIIGGFMIQGGDVNSRDDDRMNDGSGDIGYTIPAEFRPDLFHKRGAIAAARTPDNVNPNRESSGSQFYIVHGTIYPDDVLEQMEKRLRQTIPDSTFAYSDDARHAYKTIGGAPILDMQYTVFGEIVQGIETVDTITRVVTPASLGQSGMPQPNNPIIPTWMMIRAMPEYEE